MYHGINLSWVLGFKLRPLINLVEFFRKKPRITPQIRSISRTRNFNDSKKCPVMYRNVSALKSLANEKRWFIYNSLALFPSMKNQELAKP
jgi:hypothetical protein